MAFKLFANVGCDIINHLAVKSVSIVNSVHQIIFSNQLVIRRWYFSCAIRNVKTFSLHKFRPKLVELRTLFNRVYAYLEKFTLFYNRGFGFGNEHSTFDVLVEFTKKIETPNQ